jgi:hypothetical protein
VKAPDAVDSVVVVETEGPPDADATTRLLSPTVPEDTLRAFDGVLHGPGLAFGAGKTRDAWVHRWSDPKASVRWPVRLGRRTTYEVAISYDAEAASAGGQYAVKLGPQTLTGTVAPTAKAPLTLGRVTLEPGTFEIAVEATHIAGSELMKLRGLVLRPVTSTKR